MQSSVVRAGGNFLEICHQVFEKFRQITLFFFSETGETKSIFLLTLKLFFVGTFSSAIFKFVKFSETFMSSTEK